MLEHSRPELQYNSDRTTRLTCWVGLVLSTMVGVGAIIGGCLIPGSHFDSSAVGFKGFFMMPLTIKELIPLLLNFVVTACTECLGMIHATSLKWALFEEGRLEFNSNLRLFTFARHSWPNSRISNAVYFIGLALCYAATPSVIIPVGFQLDNWLFTVPRSGLFCLGAGLLAQCVICFWSITTANAPTWSSNALMTVAAAKSRGLQRREGRCMYAACDQNFDPRPMLPMPVQKSAYAVHAHVRTVLLAIIIIFCGLVIWSVVTCVLLSAQTRSGDGAVSWSLLGDGYYGLYSTIKFWPDPSFEIAVFTEILVSLLIQSIVTIGLHCAQLQITLSRDEATWRAVLSETGSNADCSGIFLVLKHWQSVALLTLDPVIHWVYGLAINVGYDGLMMWAPRIVYLTSLWGIFLAFTLFVSLQKPKGPLPATYGHLQTLSDLIDDWSVKMYWGHKSEGIDGVCHAGTSPEKLPEVKMDRFYQGHRGTTDSATLQCRAVQI